MTLNRQDSQKIAQDKFRANNKDYLKEYERERYLKSRTKVLENYHANKTIKPKPIKTVKLEIKPFKPRKKYSVFYVLETLRKDKKSYLNWKTIASFDEKDWLEFKRIEKLT